MMKIGNGLRVAVRIAMVLLLLFPAVGCPRKTIIFHLDPASLLFSGAPENGSPLPDQILTMTGIDEIPSSGVSYTIETDQPWLTVTPSSGQLHANEAIDLTVHTDQTGLGPNLYSGQIHIVARYHKHRYPQSLDVTLEVIPQSPPPIVNPEE
jgi:hypothetical protein